MNTKILVFEDNVYTANEISIRLKNAGYRYVDIAVTKSQAFKAIEKSHPDIAILDIREKTDHTAGIKIAERIRKINPIPIIYFTANPSDKSNVYETKPNAFIEKPNYNGVLHAIDLAFRNFYGSDMASDQEQAKDNTYYFSNDYLFVLKKGLYFKIEHRDISYVHSSSGCILINTTEDVYSSSSTIKRFMEQVDLPIFIRVHKSYLVNFHHIDSFSNSQIFVSGRELPMSKAGYERLLNIAQRLRSK